MLLKQIEKRHKQSRKRLKIATCVDRLSISSLSWKGKRKMEEIEAGKLKNIKAEKAELKLRQESVEMLVQQSSENDFSNVFQMYK